MILFNLIESCLFIENYKIAEQKYLDKILIEDINKILHEADILQDKIYIDIAKDIVEDIKTQYINYITNKPSRLIKEDTFTYTLTPKNNKYPIIRLNYHVLMLGSEMITYIPSQDTIELNIMDLDQNTNLIFSDMALQFFKTNKIQEAIVHELTHREDLYKRSTNNANYVKTKTSSTNNNFVNYANDPLEVSAFTKQLITNIENYLKDAYNIRLYSQGPKINPQEIFNTINEYINTLLNNKSLGNSNISVFLNALSPKNKKKIYKELFKYFSQIFINQYPIINS